jgi:hypothetical protein
LKGPPGEVIGLPREDGFSIGMPSLEPNTDGSSVGCANPCLLEMAHWLEDGSGSFHEGNRTGGGAAASDAGWRVDQAQRLRVNQSSLDWRRGVKTSCGA